MDRVDAAVAYHGGDTEKYFGEVDGLHAPLLMHLAEEDEFISKPAQAEIKAALAMKPNAAVYSYPGQCQALSRHNGLHDSAAAAALANGRTSEFLKHGEFEIASGQHSKPIRGGLASWQIRRVTAYIEADLAAKVRIRDLAGLIKVSSSHFSRAFKQSFADSPHRYLMCRRVERAKALMLATNATLGRIAADCGFADQPHFNRYFRGLVGESPNAWRRARADAPRINDRLTLDASTARVAN